VGPATGPARSRSRQVFVAIVLDAVPLDVLVEELGTSRKCDFKVLFDTRRKIRAALVAKGYAAVEGSRRT
jgi:RNA polymerase sigma-70 factor (ECF subfamily)